MMTSLRRSTRSPTGTSRTRPQSVAELGGADHEPDSRPRQREIVGDHIEKRVREIRVCDGEAARCREEQS